MCFEEWCEEVNRIQLEKGHAFLIFSGDHYGIPVYAIDMAWHANPYANSPEAVADLAVMCAEEGSGWDGFFHHVYLSTREIFRCR